MAVPDYAGVYDMPFCHQQLVAVLQSEEYFQWRCCKLKTEEIELIHIRGLLGR